MKLGKFRYLGGLCVLVLVLQACGGDSNSPCDFDCAGDTVIVSTGNACYCARADGTREGKYIQLYPSGARMLERHYTNGKISGVILSWTQNGFLLSEHEWTETAESLFAKFTIYHHGLLVLNGQYADGLPEGGWSYYDLEDGSPVMKTFYDNGIHCGSQHDCWDQDSSTEILCESVLDHEGCALMANEIQCRPCGERGSFYDSATRQMLSAVEPADAIYSVIVNPSGYYSMFPQNRALPAGWSYYGFSGTKQECIDKIKELWTDVRPPALKSQMDAM